MISSGFIRGSYPLKLEDDNVTNYILIFLAVPRGFEALLPGLAPHLS